MAKFLTTAGVARMLGTNEATVRRLADKGALPCSRDNAGRRVFVESAIGQGIDHLAKLGLRRGGSGRR